MVKLDDLLRSRWWEKMKELIRNRQKALAHKILYWDCMDVPDKNLTQKDYKKGRDWFSMVKKTYSVRFPKCK